MADSAPRRPSSVASDTLNRGQNRGSPQVWEDMPACQTSHINI